MGSFYSLKIALMRAQHNTTNNLYPYDYWNMDMEKMLKATNKQDKQKARKQAILERDVYDHIAVNVEQLATWTGRERVWVLRGLNKTSSSKFVRLLTPKPPPKPVKWSKCRLKVAPQTQPLKTLLMLGVLLFRRPPNRSDYFFLML